MAERHSLLDSHGGVAHAPRPIPVAQAAPASFAPVSFEALPPLSVDVDGWLIGPGTRKEPAGIQSGSGWHFGHPIGVLNHFTDGCGDPHDTLVSRGVSAHGCTLGDGTLVQYVPFTRLSFHAYDEAYYDIGWENAAAPGLSCDFASHQLCRLAQLNAVVIAWTKTTFGFDIPIARAPGLAFTPGIKCHTDGLDPTGNSNHWDPNGHWDAPWRATGDPIAQWVDASERAALDRSPWSADDFVAAVQHYSGGDDMTPEDKATLTKAAQSAQRFEDYLDGETAALTKDQPPAGSSDAFVRGFSNMRAALSRPKPTAAGRHDHLMPAGRTGAN